MRKTEENMKVADYLNRAKGAGFTQALQLEITGNRVTVVAQHDNGDEYRATGSQLSQALLKLLDAVNVPLPSFPFVFGFVVDGRVTSQEVSAICEDDAKEAIREDFAPLVVSDFNRLN